MALQFGVFDHIEPVPGLSLEENLPEAVDPASEAGRGPGFTPITWRNTTPPRYTAWPLPRMCFSRRYRSTPPSCVLAPAFTSAFAPPNQAERRDLHAGQPERRADGNRRGPGRGFGGLFLGQDSDVEVNYARFLETLAIVQEGLAQEELNYHGEFYDFDQLPMRLSPKQSPHPPLWYMRNIATSAHHGECVAGRAHVGVRPLR